ncbi:ATPase [Limibacterium fermenti]|uniref:ATPase n=1 Tax=Limibacterium fermenti TaxID=3229863 RepID=UPI003A6A4A07
MKSIVIADSGATKTDWCFVQDGQIIRRFPKNGISPVYQSEEEIAQEIREQVYPSLRDEEIEAICFYGSGCIPEKIEGVKRAIQASFPIEDVQVYSDLIAAAHALCGHTSGIACILGTGSNSCQWNGKEVIAQVSPLGFILGDEGSGAVMGKHLVSDALKNQLTDGLKEELLAEYALTPATIIDSVYRQPFPSRFLARLAPFLLKHIKDPTISRIVHTSFSDFFERNVMQYDYKNNKVHFVGSIAYYFQDILHSTAKSMNIETGSILQSPMEGLIHYYHHSLIAKK